MGLSSRAVDIWVALSECGEGTDAPGLSILPRRLDTSVRPARGRAPVPAEHGGARGGLRNDAGGHAAVRARRRWCSSTSCACTRRPAIDPGSCVTAMRSRRGCLPLPPCPRNTCRSSCRRHRVSRRSGSDPPGSSVVVLAERIRHRAVGGGREEPRLDRVAVSRHRRIDRGAVQVHVIEDQGVAGLEDRADDLALRDPLDDTGADGPLEVRGLGPARRSRRGDDRPRRFPGASSPQCESATHTFE